MNLLLTFTFNISLKDWFKTGVFFREVLLYKKLKEKGIDITFLTFGDKNDLRYKKLLNGIDITPIYDYIKSRNSNITFLKSFLLPLRLKNLFKKVDIIKTNQIEGSWIAFISKLFYRKRLIVRGGFEWLRTYIDRFEIRENKNYIKYFLNYLKIYLCESIAYNLADVIILTSKSDINFILKKFKLKRKRKKIFLLYNFINTQLFRGLDIEKKDKHILYIGKLYEAKNVVNLLLAFNYLKDFKLDIIGDGPQKEELIKLAKSQGNNVKFLGIISNDKLPEIINQYQIFIIPSYYEGNPKALLEAMSCGIACIGSNVKGIKNIITHRENGYLCETDSKSIANAIMTVYNDKNLMKEIGGNARQYILKNCSLETIVQREYSIYKELLKNS